MLEKVKVILAEVVSVNLKHKQACCETGSGSVYFISGHNKGLRWNDVKVGDVVELEITSKFPKLVMVRYANT